jgi:hypothetical protein
MRVDAGREAQQHRLPLYIAEHRARSGDPDELLSSLFVPQQVENPANARYHYDATAREMREQTGGAGDALVIGAGTGRTFSGVLRYFRGAGCRARGVLVEPQGSIWGGGSAGPRRVEGIGGSYWPGALDRGLIDEIILVKDDAAFETVKALARAPISSSSIETRIGSRRAVPLKHMCSRKCETPSWPAGSSRDPALTQKPIAIERAPGLVSPRTRSPFGSVASRRVLTRPRPTRRRARPARASGW